MRIKRKPTIPGVVGFGLLTIKIVMLVFNTLPVQKSKNDIVE